MKSKAYKGTAGGIPAKIGGGLVYKSKSMSGHGKRLQDPSKAKPTRSRANEPLTKRTGGY